MMDFPENQAPTLTALLDGYYDNVHRRDLVGLPPMKQSGELPEALAYQAALRLEEAWFDMKRWGNPGRKYYIFFAMLDTESDDEQV